jgi:hypothetical protein
MLSPIQRPFLTEVRNAFNQWTSINQQIKFMNKKINGLGTLLCPMNTGDAEVFLGDRFINGDIS